MVENHFNKAHFKNKIKIKKVFKNGREKSISNNKNN